MQLEVGTIVEGKVTGITKFGAFVELPGGKTGMVHISEVSNTFVKEIRDFLTEQQMVKVKVLNISEDGKVSLSIKRASETPAGEGQRGPRGPRTAGANRPGQGGGSRPYTPRPQQRRSSPRVDSFEYASRRSNEPMSFEDMLSQFKQNSEERICDIKRNTERKNRTRRK